jgi:galactokinase
VKHTLASSEYNVRRLQCENGLNLIKDKCPEVETFRDVSERQLIEYVLPFDKVVFNRCKYVINEIRRVNEACDHLEGGDIQELGKLLYSTHEGLSNEYEVSCFELDFLVESVKGNEHVLGARMMGGGFGGCTLNIIKNDEINSLNNQLKDIYQETTGLQLDIIKVNTANGVEIVF